MAKILVVDDEKDIRDVVKTVLGQRGHKIQLAKDANDCIEVAKKFGPDLILMDILMPGTQVIEALKKLTKYKIIIFSVITLNEQFVAETGEKIPSKLKFLNIVDYLQKPIENKILVEKIELALSK